MINAELERFQVDFTHTKDQPDGDLFEEALRLDSGSHNLQTRANTVGSQGSILSSSNREFDDDLAFIDPDDKLDLDDFNSADREELFEDATEEGEGGAF